jgi:hypothetical protein
MKAFKEANDNARLLKPDLNIKRMNFSMQRMAMLALDLEGFCTVNSYSIPSTRAFK